MQRRPSRALVEHSLAMMWMCVKERYLARHYNHVRTQALQLIRIQRVRAASMGGSTAAWGGAAAWPAGIAQASASAAAGGGELTEDKAEETNIVENE